jgi:transcriptional regulator with XRE-family HTH domain
MLKVEVGLRLKKVRLTLGHKVSGMAALLGINKMTYMKNETGTHFPSASTLYNLASQYNVSSDWILCGRGTMFYGQKEEEAKNRQANKSADMFTRQIDEMAVLMKNIPLVYHSIMGYFLRFKVDNEAYLDREMARLKETTEEK